MEIDDAFKIISMVGTIVLSGVGIWGLWRWRTVRKMAQAEFLEGLMKQFSDDEILSLICSVDSDGGAVKYLGDPSNEKNRKVIEKSLTLMSYLCHLHKGEIISHDAFSMFKGRLMKMLRDSQVRNYLASELRGSTAITGAYSPLFDFMHAEGIELDLPTLQADEEDADVDGTSENLSEEDFDQPTAIIKINRLYRDGMSDEQVYEVVRGWWRLRLDVAKKVKLVIAVAHGIVRGVYTADSWEPAHDPAEAGRIGFTGKPAEKIVRDKYMNRSVRALFSKGAVNPVRYFNV